MFCPSCGTQIPDGSRLCGSCGADLSARGAGAPAAPAPGQVPVLRVPIPARHASAARGRVIAGVAVAVAVALVVAVGLHTGWFGLAGSHLVPGTYTFSSSSVSYEMVLSVTEGDHVGLTIGKDSWVEGDARVSQAGSDHLHVQAPLTTAVLHEPGATTTTFEEMGVSRAGIAALGLDDDQPSGYTLNLVVPRGAPDSIVGTWAWWIEDERGLPHESEDYFGWVEVEGDGSFRVGDVSSSDAAAAAVKSLKAGNFRGNSEFMSGSWVRQSDGSFVLTSYGNAVTFQHRR